MSRPGNDYEFFSANADEIVATLTSTYEQLTGRTVHPASAVKLFISWVASAILQIYNKINYAGNQNIPSRAVGENLDALGELFYEKKRPQATKAQCTMQFTISAAQSTSILIPAGTRITNVDGDPVFATVEDVHVEIGATTATVLAKAVEPGASGNGYAAGQLSTLVDVFPYYASCTNTTITDGGSDTYTDDEYYDLMVSSQDGYTTAGSTGSYIYHAKSVGSEIEDVVVNSPSAGKVDIYASVDGAPASTTIKNKIAAACSADTVRPLTDLVTVKDPDQVTYNIDITFYISNDSPKSAAQVLADVTAAVDAFVKWQSEKIGRDINPSKLNQMVLDAGAKRCVITYPTFVALKDGTEVPAVTPEIAKLGTRTVTNGGYENE